MTYIITTLNITTLSTNESIMALSIINFNISSISTECCCCEFHVLIVMQSVVLHNVIVSSVVMRIVVAPLRTHHFQHDGRSH